MQGVSRVELEFAFVGCADQVLRRATSRNRALAQGGLGNFGVPANLQFDPKEQVWSKLSLPIGLPVTCLPTLRSAKIRISKEILGSRLKNILAVLIVNIRLHRRRGTEFKNRLVTSEMVRCFVHAANYPF